MFMNHIENIGLFTSLVFSVSETDYAITKDFGVLRLGMIEITYQDLELFTITTDNIKDSNSTVSTLGFLTQYFLAEEINNHH